LATNTGFGVSGGEFIDRGELGVRTSFFAATIVSFGVCGEPRCITYSLLSDILGD
jgi:hypothetical protein